MNINNYLKNVLCLLGYQMNETNFNDIRGVSTTEEYMLEFLSVLKYDEDLSLLSYIHLFSFLVIRFFEL